MLLFRTPTTKRVREQVKATPEDNPSITSIILKAFIMPINQKKERGKVTYQGRNANLI